MKDGDHHLLAGTVTCCQCPPMVENYLWMIAMQNLLDRKTHQLRTRAAIPVLPITMGYSVVLLETLPLQHIKSSDPYANQENICRVTIFPCRDVPSVQHCVINWLN